MKKFATQEEYDEHVAQALAELLLAAFRKWEREHEAVPAGQSQVVAVREHGRAFDERVLTTEELLKRVPLDRSTIWRMSREGRFPKPIQLTPGRIGWRWSAVLAWLKDREENPEKARTYFNRAGTRGAKRK